MKLKFSTKEEFLKFMYDKKLKHGSIQSTKEGFKDLYDEVQPFPESAMDDNAILINKMFIHNEWTSLINADKSFFEKNGYIEVEYDVNTAKISLAKRHRGRPASNNSITKNISIRLTNDKLSLIDNYCTTQGIDNRSQFIKIAIDRLLKNT